MYCSSSPRSLAVPGIGYCQSIPVDQDSFDLVDCPTRPPRHGWARIWTGWACQDVAEPPPAAHELH
jgi:hypothetical protein